MIGLESCDEILITLHLLSTQALLCSQEAVVAALGPHPGVTVTNLVSTQHCFDQRAHRAKLSHVEIL